jgi:hypothetical protein
MSWKATPRQAHDLVRTARLRPGDVIEVVYEGLGESPREDLSPPHLFSLSIDRPRGVPRGDWL